MGTLEWRETSPSWSRSSNSSTRSLLLILEPSPVLLPCFPSSSEEEAKLTSVIFFKLNRTLSHLLPNGSNFEKKKKHSCILTIKIRKYCHFYSRINPLLFHHCFADFQ